MRGSCLAWARRARWLLAAIVIVIGASRPVALAQPADPTPSGPAPAAHDAEARDIDHVVARALLERARELLAQGDARGARELLVESLERSPGGPHAHDARALLAAANQALGRRPGDGVPAGTTGPGRAPGTANPQDPYAEPGAAGPLDPYAEPDAAGPLDPYAEPDAAGPLDPYAEPDPDDPRAAAQVTDDESLPGATPEPSVSGPVRLTSLAHGGLLGLFTGLMITDPWSGDGSSGWGVLGATIGMSAGLAVTHLGLRKYHPTEGQAAAVHWGALGGALTFGVITDLATGLGTTTSGELLAGVTLGGLIGTGAGMLYARRVEPAAGDVALVSSLGLYGMATGLLLGVAMDPPYTEGYSLNALIGAALGVGGGVLAARRIDTSRARMRWVDGGAALGALAPWIVVYPLARGSSGGARITGLLSALGVPGGAYLAWRLTRHMDASPEVTRPGASEPAPALIQRHGDGAWTPGTLSLRPVTVSAPAGHDVGLIVDLVSGRF